MVFGIIRLCRFCRALVGICIVCKACELYSKGYVSTELIDGITILTADSPELITLLFLVWLGAKLMP